MCVSEPTFPGCVGPGQGDRAVQDGRREGARRPRRVRALQRPRVEHARGDRRPPEQLRREIGHFFDVYKDLDPDRHSEVIGWGDREAAFEAIEERPRAFRAAAAMCREAAARCSTSSCASSPHAARAFNLSARGARRPDPRPVGRRRARSSCDDRRWTPEKAKLTIHEGPELRPEEMGLGAGGPTSPRAGRGRHRDAARRRSARRPAGAGRRAQGGDRRRVVRGRIRSREVVALAAAQRATGAGQRAAGAAEQAVWELLHQRRVRLLRGRRGRSRRRNGSRCCWPGRAGRERGA